MVGSDVRGGFFGFDVRHLETATFENASFLDYKLRRPHVPAKSAGRADLDPAVALDVPAYGTVDLYLASLDVRVNRRLFTDNEDISGCDRSVDVVIDPERTRVSKLTGERRSVVQESLEVVERRLPAQFQNFFSRPDERVLCNDQPMLSIWRRTF